MRHQSDYCKIMDEPNINSIIEKCTKGQRWDDDQPTFGDFILEENLDGGWRKDVRNKRFVVTGSIVLSALVGLLIPIFATSVVYGVKVIAESTTKSILRTKEATPKKGKTGQLAQRQHPEEYNRKNRSEH